MRLNPTRKTNLIKTKKNHILIAKTNERLRKEFDTSAEAVRLSVDTLVDHFRHEDDGVGVFDYSILRHLINDKNAKIEKGNKDRHIVYFSKYGVDYKAVLKTTEKDEIYLVSLITIKRSKAK